jgi:hypothetical protein
VGAVPSYAFTNAAANHTISATFAINIYTLTSAGAHGAITPPGVTNVPHGSNGPTYVMVPDSGYAVQDVLVDGVSVGTPTSYPFPNVITSHTISVTFSPTGQVVFGAPTSVISPGTPCVTVPVNIVRTPGAIAIRGYSVKFTLSPNLTLCSGTSSLTEGTYLNSGWTTSYHVTGQRERHLHRGRRDP